MVTKKQKKASAAGAAKAKQSGEKPKLSLVRAAAAVLGEADEPMNAKRIVERAKASGLWTPGEGKTPEQTLYSAIVREIKAKGESSRFRLAGKGLFALAAR